MIKMYQIKTIQFHFEFGFISQMSTQDLFIKYLLNFRDILQKVHIKITVCDKIKEKY